MRHFVWFFLSMLATASASDDPAPRLQSRNMPSDCEFVFRVESDIVITGAAPEPAPDHLEYELQDLYTESWSAPRLLEVSTAVGATWNASLTLVSMSENPRYLYRKIRFRPVDSQGARGVTWYSEFARQWGEACHPGGRDETPFREREVRAD